MDESMNPSMENSPAEAGKKNFLNMRTAVIIALILIIGAVIFYYKGLLVAATVNGSPISRLEVIKELEKNSGKQVLSALIVQKLIDSEASKNKITVSSSEIDASVKTVEDQIKAQGGTLDQALTAQGLTLEDFKKQLTVQKKLEKLLASKATVTDEEIAKYIKDNKVPVAAGQEEAVKAQVATQLQQQKMNAAVGSYIQDLQSKASIKHFVSY
ncbi:MAG: SurA N-terminal domain-containing protein [Candidatus Paceibacterota bacterium]